MEITRLDSGSEGVWRNFLSENTTLVIHSPDWKEFFEKSFPKTKIVYYAAVDSGALQLVFPFTFVKHPIFGSKAISCGFIEYGGPAGSASQEAVKAVLEQVKRDAAGAEYVEIRQGLHEFDPILSESAVKDVPYKRGITLLGEPEKVFESFDRHTRKAVRKSEKEGVAVRELSEADIEAVYGIYLRGMKFFGSPPVAEKFFRNFWGILVSRGFAKGFGSFKEGKLAAILLGYTYAGRIHIIINVSEPELQKHFVNDAVHWRFIEWGCEKGYKEFDWGRVREESGQYQFKKKWSTVFSDLNHYYLLPPGRTEPPKVDPTNKKYALAIEAWKRLPLSVSRRIGPWLREGLGI